jgi:hypothetical protein
MLRWGQRRYTQRFWRRQKRPQLWLANTHCCRWTMPVRIATQHSAPDAIFPAPLPCNGTESAGCRRLRTAHCRTPSSTGATPPRRLPAGARSPRSFARSGPWRMRPATGIRIFGPSGARTARGLTRRIFSRGDFPAEKRSRWPSAGALANYLPRWCDPVTDGQSPVQQHRRYPSVPLFGNISCMITSFAMRDLDSRPRRGTVRLPR